VQVSKQRTAPFPQPQQRILTALAEMQEASNVQLCRRWYKPGSIAGIWRNIAALERQGLIAHRPRLLRQSADGPAQRLYFLTTAGRKVMRAGPQTKSIGYIGQEHRYLVNDLWCALYEWERESAGRMTIVETIHDSVLKQQPLIVPVDGKAVKAVPDSWYHIRTDGIDRRYWIEADRGTENEDGVFRRKIRVIERAATHRVPQRRFGGTGFRVLFIVAPAEPRRMGRRLEQIVTWMEKELTARGAKDLAPLFLVAALDPGAVSGEAIFTAPYFVSPFARSPKAAIAL
jgi:protein involved in plasmid replication-relaxation